MLYRTRYIKQDGDEAILIMYLTLGPATQFLNLDTGKCDHTALLSHANYSEWEEEATKNQKIHSCENNAPGDAAIFTAGLCHRRQPTMVYDDRRRARLIVPLYVKDRASLSRMFV